MPRFSPPKADRLKPRALVRSHLSAAGGGRGFSPNPPSFQLGRGSGVIGTVSMIAEICSGGSLVNINVQIDDSTLVYQKHSKGWRF